MTLYVEDLRRCFLSPAFIVICVIVVAVLYMVFIQAPAIAENMENLNQEKDFVINADCTQLRNFINEEIKTDVHYEQAVYMAKELYEVNCK